MSKLIIRASRLPSVVFRVALLAVLRSKRLDGATIGVMITASHNPEQVSPPRGRPHHRIMASSSSTPRARCSNRVGSLMLQLWPTAHQQTRSSRRLPRLLPTFESISPPRPPSYMLGTRDPHALSLSKHSRRALMPSGVSRSSSWVSPPPPCCTTWSRLPTPRVRTASQPLKGIKSN